MATAKIPFLPNPHPAYNASGQRTTAPQFSRDEMNEFTEKKRLHDENLIRKWLYKGARGVGADPGLADLLTAPVAFSPGLGDLMDAEDARNAFNKGDYIGMLLAGGAAALPMVSGPVARGARKMGKKAKKGIRAFHGSPHHFDEFRMDKIGTGEGAQAYGHGLYFAEKEDVAQGYRQALQHVDLGPLDKIGIPPKEWNAARMFIQNADETQMDAAARDFAQWTGQDVTPELVEAFKKAKNSGSMYEVNINADPEDFLDWDKPLSEQGETVRKSVSDELIDRKYPLDESGVPSWLSRDPDGQSIAASLGSFDNHGAKQIEGLRKRGVPGIKYLDQGSRAAGEGSRNYVVFDESLIEIVRKYGLAAAIGAGIISQEMGAQMQAQGDI